MNSTNTIHPDSQSIWSRPSSIFIAAALTLLIALLIPCPAIVLDVTWIFALLIAGSVAWVCVAVKSSTDLIGLAPLVWFVTLLRLALQTVAAGKIIRNHRAGTLLETVGRSLAASGTLGVLLVCLLLAAIAVFIVFAACQRITNASNNYLQNILPLKKIGIQTDLGMGTIDAAAAETLQQRITCESRFFWGMNGAALLMRGEAAISIFTLIGCLIIPMTAHSPDAVLGADRLGQMAPPVVALSVFSLIPAIVVSVSSAALMSRDTLTLRTEQNDQAVVPPQKITIVTGPNNRKEEFELLNPECLDHRNVDERIVEFEPSVHPKSSLPPEPQGPPARMIPVAESIKLPCKDANDYYEQLYGLITTRDSKSRLVLLASDQLRSLPVTVPVNLAIRLARKNKKVLLVDSARRQNAVAQVFEMDPERIRKKIQKSCFENLSVCAVPQANLSRLMAKDDLLKRFDTTLIFAPGITGIETESSGSSQSFDVLYFTDAQPAFTLTADQSFRGCASVRLVPGIRSILAAKQ